LGEKASKLTRLCLAYDGFKLRYVGYLVLK